MRRKGGQRKPCRPPNGLSIRWAAISGIAGIGHILLGVSMVLLLAQVKRAVSAAKV